MAEQATEHQQYPMNRTEIIDHFLSANGWHGASRVKLAGDASFREYDRIFLENRQAVLMDAPPDKEDVRPFIRVAEHLVESKLSAPRILAADVENGLLLLEDLGDDLFVRVLHREPELESDLYHAAAEVLVQLYHSGTDGIPHFDIEQMLLQVGLLPEWFIPLVSGHKADEHAKHEYLLLWRDVLHKMPRLREVTVLYDFHAENMIWLPERSHGRRAGLLDFQDAVVGSPAYDMVSFLEDARRDVKKETITSVIDYYLKQTHIPRAEFMAAYHVMGAQRNCRIIGTFARLSVRDNKPRYLAYMKRVWQHVENDLNHPLLLPIRHWMDKNIKPEWRK